MLDITYARLRLRQNKHAVTAKVKWWHCLYIYSIAYTKQNDLLAHFPHVVIGNYVTFNTVIMCLRCEARNHHQEYDKFIAYAWIFNVEYGDNAGVVWVRSNRW